MPALIILSGKNKGKTLRLPEREIFVGRDEDCAIRLASTDVSRHHCRMRTLPGGFLAVRDLDSRNGTFVNDVLIQKEIVLQPGDVLKIGPVAFQVPGAAEPAKGEPVAKPAPVAAPSRATSALDDEIANWLTDDDAPLPPAGSESGETAIYKGPTPSATDDGSDDPPAATIRRQFASLADEAADIIARHKRQLERQAERKADESGTT